LYSQVVLNACLDICLLVAPHLFVLLICFHDQIEVACLFLVLGCVFILFLLRVNMVKFTIFLLGHDFLIQRCDLAEEMLPLHVPILELPMLLHYVIH